jgi:hypothetical protein
MIREQQETVGDDGTRQEKSENGRKRAEDDGNRRNELVAVGER